ncbi:3D domain-containing protein [Bacillus sp. S13(2024)]|uniref:3D domain-containing protein n=1 Tax=Bacillus sp. S13(2024) TaxID=3162885 RepID=UPI003D1EE70E
MKALTLLGVLAAPISAPNEVVIHSTHMNVLENDAIHTFNVNGEIKTIKVVPANRQEQIESFQKATQEYEERLKREEEQRRLEEEARQKAEQEERERIEREIESWHDGVFTAYYPANNRMEGGSITATGYNLNNGIYYQGYRVIAADPSIPLYSIVEIKIGDEVMECQVLDRGGRIKGNLFDVAHEDGDSSNEFGRKYGQYRVVREGK